MKTSIFLYLFLFLTVFSVHAEEASLPPGFYEKISSSLPEGWHCLQHSNAVVIVRDRVVYFVTADLRSLPLISGKEWQTFLQDHTAPAAYAITIRIFSQDPMSPEKYREIDASNQRLMSRISELRRKMDYGKGSLSMKLLQPEEATELIELTRKYQTLPDAYDKDHSYLVRTSRPPDWTNFEEDSVARECREILRKVLDHFSLYQEDKEKVLNQALEGSLGRTGFEKIFQMAADAAHENWLLSERGRNK